MKIVLQAWHRVEHLHTCYCAKWVSDTMEFLLISSIAIFANASLTAT